MFYSKNDIVYNKNFLEMYFPKSYFDKNYYAVDYGNKVNIFGLFPIREIIDGVPQETKMFNIPMFIDIRTYHMKSGVVTVNDKSLEVFISEYPKDSALFSKKVPQTAEIAEKFIKLIMDGKVPSIVEYPQFINILWKSLEIAGINLRVPSTLYEALIMTMCRNKKNIKERFGINYGKNLTTAPTDYTQLNTRDVVASLSTFSGIIFEDIDAMIANGIANTIDEVDEPVSPMEKLLYY